MANNAPVVTAINKNVFVNSFISAADLFSVNDADGDTIQRYRFFDFSNESATGLFELNGSPRFNGTQTEIAANELSNLVYLAGSSISNERIRIQAFDGEDWSDSAVVSFAYSVRQNVTKPNVVVSQTSVLSNEFVTAASFISATDPDGYPIQQYMIRDRNSNNSYFSLNGQKMESGEYFTVNADQMEDLRYYSFGGKTSTERVDAFAYDGAEWSDFGSANVESRFNENRPSTQFTSAVVPSRENIGIGDKIFFTDADGNTAKRFRIYDTSDHDFSGFLTRNGVELAAKQWHEVTYSRVDEFRYTGSDRNFNEKMRVRVYDGRYWSPVQTVVFETIARPTVGLAQNVVDSHLEEIELSSLIFQTDNGPAHLSYEIIETNADPLSGTLRRNGFRREANQVYNVSPSELVDNWTFETGTYDFRQLDELYVRPDNGTFKGDWKRIQFRSEPEYIAALDSGGSWLKVLQNGAVTAQPLQVTYSFMQQFPDYETGEAVDEPPPADPPRPYRDFFQHQRDAARRVFRQLESFAHVEFVEVSDTSLDPMTGYRGGKIRMGNYQLETDEAAGAFAFLPGGGPGSEAPQTGDMWFNAAKMDVFSPAAWLPGGASYATFMHELGHAKGLMHPFDDPNAPDNRPTLPFSTDNDIYTVMSYSGHPAGFQFSPGSFGLYDVANLQRLYGANTAFAAGNDVYGIDTTFEGNQDWTWTIWDTGGIDTITADGSLINATVDLRSGGHSSIGAIRNNLTTAFGSIIENGTGSANNDTIFGNEVANTLLGGLGDDYIRGLGGDDFVSGGGGNDRFEWGIADGNDTIDEQQGAGIDTIALTSFPKLDDFSTDLSFRKSGRDLIIDLNIDQGLTQGSLQVVNQKWGAYQVESLELGSTRVDLRELFQIATSTSTRFRVLEESTSFGNLVAPI